MVEERMTCRTVCVRRCVTARPWYTARAEWLRWVGEKSRPIAWGRAMGRSNSRRHAGQVPSKQDERGEGASVVGRLGERSGPCPGSGRSPDGEMRLLSRNGGAAVCDLSLFPLFHKRTPCLPIRLFRLASLFGFGTNTPRCRSRDSPDAAVQWSNPMSSTLPDGRRTAYHCRIWQAQQ